MPNNDILLEVSHVSKHFPVKKRELHAVSDVSLTLSRGELLGIVGESGCGKSTMARMIVGSLPVSSGSMKLDGVDCVADGSVAPLGPCPMNDVADQVVLASCRNNVINDYKVPAAAFNPDGSPNFNVNNYTWQRAVVQNSVVVTKKFGYMRSKVP